MRVTVTVSGSSFEIEADPQESVEALKARVVPGGFVGRAIFAGRELPDTITLAEGGVQKGSTLYFVPPAAPAAAATDPLSVSTPLPPPQVPADAWLPPPPSYQPPDQQQQQQFQPTPTPLPYAQQAMPLPPQPSSQPLFCAPQQPQQPVVLLQVPTPYPQAVPQPPLRRSCMDNGCRKCLGITAIVFAALCFMSLPGIAASVISNAADKDSTVFSVVFPAVFGGGMCLICGIVCCVLGCMAVNKPK